MKREELFEKLKAIINSVIGVTQPLKEDHNLENDLGFDSLDNIEVIMVCEKEFNISIADEDIFNIKTIKDVLDYLEKKVN